MAVKICKHYIITPYLQILSLPSDPTATLGHNSNINQCIVLVFSITITSADAIPVIRRINIYYVIWECTIGNEWLLTPPVFVLVSGSVSYE